VTQLRQELPQISAAIEVIRQALEAEEV